LFSLPNLLGHCFFFPVLWSLFSVYLFIVFLLMFFLSSFVLAGSLPFLFLNILFLPYKPFQDRLPLIILNPLLKFNFSSLIFLPWIYILPQFSFVFSKGDGPPFSPLALFLWDHLQVVIFFGHFLPIMFVSSVVFWSFTLLPLPSYHHSMFCYTLFHGCMPSI